MALIVAGLSHRTAPLEVRERCVVGAGEVHQALESIAASAGVREALVVSTCNRTEFYLVEDDRDATPAVWEYLTSRLGGDIMPYAYAWRERDAVAHLFRVTSGMDSMILGESQIHGQVRTAWELGRSHAGALLHRLFQSALQVSARVRTETDIGRGAASVSSAAVQLARQIFGSLEGRLTMVLGSGEMAGLALECLRGEGARAIVVAGRTHSHALELARAHDATAVAFEECWSRLRDVDLLLCSTAAPVAVVTVDRVAAALPARGGRPLCILDIAVPRDVDPRVGALETVFLYDIDDLRAVVAANLATRRDELPSAESVIAEETERYWQWVAGLSAVPVVTSLRERAERVRAHEVAAVLRRMPDLSADQRAAVEQLSRSLMNKFLHEPSVRLRSAVANGRGLAIVDAARYLFAVEDAPAGTPSPPRTPSDAPSSSTTSA